MCFAAPGAQISGVIMLLDPKRSENTETSMHSIFRPKSRRTVGTARHQRKTHRYTKKRKPLLNSAPHSPPDSGVSDLCREADGGVVGRRRLCMLELVINKMERGRKQPLQEVIISIKGAN